MYMFGVCTGAVLMFIVLYFMTGIVSKRRSLMDRLYIFNLIFVSVVVIVSFVAMFCQNTFELTDLSPIGTIVPAAFLELGVHSGFMVWKAKVENCRKYKDVNRLEQMEGEI